MIAEVRRGTCSGIVCSAHHLDYCGGGFSFGLSRKYGRREDYEYRVLICSRVCLRSSIEYITLSGIAGNSVQSFNSDVTRLISDTAVIATIVLGVVDLISLTILLSNLVESSYLLPSCATRSKKRRRELKRVFCQDS